MIRAADFRRSYGAVRAVDGVSFAVGKGKIAGFLGPNGAGKTTTIKAFIGFLAPSEGALFINGLNTELHPLETKAVIGYLPENNPLYEDMEVADYLLYNGAVRGLAGQKLDRAVKNAVERCGLGEVIGRDIGELSRGYRQRTGLANAIVHDPPVLFLDEPTGGLDPNQAEGVRMLIRELGREKTILFSTHMLEEARRVCDELLVIARGRLVAQGPAAKVLGGEESCALTLCGDIDEAAVRARLSALAGVTRCESARSGGETRFTVSAPGNDLRRAVYSASVENGWPVLELKKEASSLEDVFRSLTS
ncbi:MAG: ATP-binding cassette domain-containing protein [Elusimicrobiaceae bacterium]|nr:ATP-binding cassette domain-containing protein [Elusimicrobiaceae bacterium]